MSGRRRFAGAPLTTGPGQLGLAIIRVISVRRSSGGAGMASVFQLFSFSASFAPFGGGGQDEWAIQSFVACPSFKT